MSLYLGCDWWEPHWLRPIVVGMVATGLATPAHWLNNLEVTTQATANEMGTGAAALPA